MGPKVDKNRWSNPRQSLERQPSSSKETPDQTSASQETSTSEINTPVIDDGHTTSGVDNSTGGILQEAGSIVRIDDGLPKATVT